MPPCTRAQRALQSNGAIGFSSKTWEKIGAMGKRHGATEQEKYLFGEMLVARARTARLQASIACAAGKQISFSAAARRMCDLQRAIDESIERAIHILRRDSPMPEPRTKREKAAATIQRLANRKNAVLPPPMEAPTEDEARPNPIDNNGAEAEPAPCLSTPG